MTDDVDSELQALAIHVAKAAQAETVTLHDKIKALTAVSEYYASIQRRQGKPDRGSSRTFDTFRRDVNRVEELQEQ